MKSKNTKFTNPLNILIIEDNKIDRKILESMLSESLSKGSVLKAVTTLASAKKLLNKTIFDIIILDLNLPDSTGLNTLKEITKKHPNIAILVNTGAYGDTQGIKTLSLGAQDFLTKGQYTPYTLNKILHYCVERKRLETELKETYEKLRDTQYQLVQSEKMKVVGGLASGVAHEVKNPLATIIYGITFLIEYIKEKDDKINTVLANIKDAAKRANDITNDLLNFSSLSELKKEYVNINSLAEKSISLLSHLFEKNKVQIVRKYNNKLIAIKVDPTRIEQVLINLILNSVNAMPKGGIISIQTSFKKLSNTLKEIPLAYRNGFKALEKVVIIQIKDTGTGIPKEKIDQVFDPFFTTRRARGGIGLGLSVSKSIIKTHNGAIFIDNIKTGGAKATLILKA